MDPSFLLLAVIILFSFIAQALSGFGGLIIAVTIGSNFFPIEFLLPVVVPQGVLLNMYIISRHHTHIQKPILFKTLLPPMMVGLLIGMLLFNYVHGDLLRKIFGIFVILISVFQLIAEHRLKNPGVRLSPAKSTILMLASGIIQGLYASGGPLLVFVAHRLGLSKSAFRSTVSGLFFSLNILLIISFTITGRMSFSTLKLVFSLVPFLAVSLIIGERLHRYINEKQFHIVIYTLLFFAGLSILVL